MSKKGKKNEIWAMRHTAEHVLHTAMQELYPKLKKAMGPATDDGFYFDFDYEGKISEADFPKIEKKMEEIIKADLPLKQEMLEEKEAREMFKDNPYKLDWIDRILERGEKISVYKMGDRDLDICSGPHAVSTGKIGAFKLLSVAGAYWHGDEKNKMLTRIYGVAFPTQKELDDYLVRLEEAKKRDHRKLGRELDLLSFHPEAPADVFWHHKGYVIMKEMFAYWREIHDRENYEEVRTPELLTKAVWKQSGHLDNFADKIYQVTIPGDDEWSLAVKPMNCDGGMLIYKTRQRSYRDLPIKMGELGVVHRYESSGETLGILRPREFTQDDAHIYCTPEQIKDELKKVMELCFEVYKTFGLKLDHLELSTRPENSIGSDEIWEKAEAIMKEVLEEGDTPFQINEGDGAFYGPKFDFHLKDAIGRTWQCSTIQLDFAQPENFDLEYITESGEKQRPVMIHRVLYGSVERFLGILIEDYAGAFPVWLSPVQAVVLPITEKQQEYAEKIVSQLKEKGVRVEIDDSNQTLSNRIRQAEVQKIPYILVVGDKEKEVNSVNVRERGEKKQEEMKLVDFISLVEKKIKTRDLLV